MEPKGRKNVDRWRSPLAGKLSCRMCRTGCGKACHGEPKAAAGILALSIGRQVEVEEFSPERAPIRSVGCSGGPDGEDLERSGPRQGELGFEDKVVGVFHRFLADVGGAVVKPNCPPRRSGGC